MHKDRILMVSHGSLAQAMLDNVEMVLGGQENVEALCLPREKTLEDFIEALRKELCLYGEEHILFFSDLKNGTPCNALLLLTKEFPGLLHITGMNMPGVIGAVLARNSLDTMSIREVCDEAVRAARDGLEEVIFPPAKAGI